MKRGKIWANLSVADLQRTTDFYTKLGFRSNMSRESADLTSFLFGKDDFIIHFFKPEILQSAMNGKVANTKQGSEVIFTLSAESEEEVREWAKKAKEAGGSIFKEASHDANGFYYCVFADPDGHKFNVLLTGPKM